MDLSQVSRLPPPPSKGVTFVYPHRSSRVDLLEKILGLMVALVFAVRQMYKRDYLTESLRWDDCKYRPRARFRFIQHANFGRYLPFRLGRKDFTGMLTRLTE